MSKEFELTPENYYSEEANKKYVSFHQYMDFAGGMLVPGCEERAMARLNGEYTEGMTVPMLVGSYVDSYFEGTLDTFKGSHPEIFTTRGELKAPYKQADIMIERCTKDKYFMATMSGEKQVIMTADLFGTPFKIKMDSYLPGKAIVDLKTAADIHRMWRIQNYGWATFVEAFCYDLQLAVYQKVVEINTGYILPAYLAVVTKSDCPEICVINIPQERLDMALETMKENMPGVLAVKRGEVEPMRCEKCDWCKRTKVLSHAISMYDLIDE